MKALGHPHLVGPQAKEPASPLIRLDLGTDLDEAWLQDLIDRCPDLLPVSTVDTRVQGPYASIGREISTPAGPIDNLLVSASGHLVIIETKLWRNPEARRKVVAQVLDYAKHVRTWNCSKIEEVWQQKTSSTDSLYSSLPNQELEEAEWIDRINENLSAGRMTLLIVGDGIRSDAESLVEVLEDHVGFMFRLALIELQVYDAGDDRLLVVPSTLARTQEIERAIVRLSSPELHGKIEIEVPKTQRGSKRVGQALDREQFLAAYRAGGSGTDEAAVSIATLIDLLEQSDLSIKYNPKSFTIEAPDPRSPGQMLSLMTMQLQGPAYFYAPYIRGQISRRWNSDSAAEVIATALIDAGMDCGGRKTPSGEQVSLDHGDIPGREAALVERLTRLVESIQALSESADMADRI